MVGRVVNNYEGKPKRDDQVAIKDKKNIDNVGSGFGSAQHGSRLDRTIHLTSGILWVDEEVPGGIGTFLVSSRYLPSLFPAQRRFVQML